MKSFKIITTDDGSHTLYREDIHESYHSFHGARGESMHVFIENGLDHILTNSTTSLKVFEVGYGTGLNALLTYNYATKTNIDIHYISLEPIPIPKSIYSELNYSRDEHEKNSFLEMHDCAWNKEVIISKEFTLSKIQMRLEDLDPKPYAGSIDIIYFDAFAPSKQEEIWNLENLKKCFSLLRNGGILTTYCAQGLFKRNLAEAGFTVETLKGALGKKEMVRGVKK